MRNSYYSSSSSSNSRYWRQTIVVLCAILALASVALLGTLLRSSQRQNGEYEQIRGRATTSYYNKAVHESKVVDDTIEQVVALPDGEFLLIVSGSSSSRRQESIVNGRCFLRFADSSSTRRTSTLVAILSGDDGRMMIRCAAMSTLQPAAAALEAAVVRYRGRIIARHRGDALEVVNWNRAVFGSLAREQDLVLFSKGIFAVKRKIPTDGARCAFFSAENSAAPAAYTSVLGIAQEIIRCEYPPVESRSMLLGNKVSVTYGDSDDSVAPSVAVYRDRELAEDRTDSRHLLCACTMIQNSAKFLREWMLYHSRIGIEKFVLYDNNSEDSIEETVNSLRTVDGLEVDVVSWPWIKAQEAGFAHCAASRRDQCKWMAFVDVDEFVFPKKWLDSNPESTNNSNTVGSSALARAIAASAIPPRNSTKMVGQISFHCRDFGPSGQSHHPTAGVTQGYTCRVLREQRHKSLLLLEAVDPSLVNAVHHFGLSQRYMTVTLSSAKGVVNHYKFQAWDEFRHKFQRRASAYVADWTQDRNIGSRDRTPGLGNKAEKPADWEQRFCEIQDTELRDYIIETMSPGVDVLPWQPESL